MEQDGQCGCICFWRRSGRRRDRLNNISRLPFHLSFISNGIVLPSEHTALFCLQTVRDSIDKILCFECGKARINQTQCQQLQDTCLSVSKRISAVEKDLFEYAPLTQNPTRAIEELCSTLWLAFCLIYDCCYHPWSYMPITRADNRESFFQIISDLHWITAVLTNVVDREAALHIDHQTDMDDSQLNIFNSYDLLKSWDQTSAEGDRRRLVSELEELTMTKEFPRTEREYALAQLMSHRLRNEKTGVISRWLPEYFWVQWEDLHFGDFLGEGSCGQVYKVTWMGESYAAKVFRGADPPLFKREAAILSSLQHPNIVQLICCSKDQRNKCCSLVLELMGQDLESVLGRKEDQVAQLSVPVAVDVMLQIARGMRYLHSKGIVHRDLNSSNVMVVGGSSGALVRDNHIRVKIVDFGMANVKARSAKFSTPRAGSIMWMAPEVIGTPEELRIGTMENKYTFKADVYSFAMTCYEILAGEIPFGKVMNGRDMYRVISSGERPSLPSCCPPYLACLIKRCWDGFDANRPSFEEICRMLSHLKGLLMRGLSTDASSLCFLRQDDVQEIVRHLGIEETLRLPDFPLKVLISWLRKLDESGLDDKTAGLELGWQIRVANFFANWEGSVHDFEESCFWVQRAAEKGLPEGIWRLGYCHELGLGVEQDDGKAVKLYLDAAEKGYVSAFVELGRCFQFGRGVTQSASQACFYWDDALELQEKTGACIKCIRELVDAVTKSGDVGEKEEKEKQKETKRELAWRRLYELSLESESGRKLVAGPKHVHVVSFVDALACPEVPDDAKFMIIRMLQKVALDCETKKEIIEAGGIAEIVHFFRWHGIANDGWCTEIVGALKSMLDSDPVAKVESIKAGLMSAALACLDDRPEMLDMLLSCLEVSYAKVWLLLHPHLLELLKRQLLVRQYSWSL